MDRPKWFLLYGMGGKPAFASQHFSRLTAVTGLSSDTARFAKHILQAKVTGHKNTQNERLELLLCLLPKHVYAMIGKAGVDPKQQMKKERGQH